MIEFAARKSGFVVLLAVILMAASSACTSEYEKAEVDGAPVAPESTGGSAEAAAPGDRTDAEAQPGNADRGRFDSNEPSRDPRTSNQLLPIDEASKDPALLAFRMQMLEAVGAHDADFLLDHVADDIRVSFGAGGGKQAFVDMWSPADPNSKIWPILGGILGGGGVFDEISFQLSDGRSADARFTAPYYFAAYPGEAFDPFQHGVIVVPDAVLRESADENAGAVDTLSFAIVRTQNFIPGSDAQWVNVTLEDGRTGYVDASEIRSPIGYRAIFHRVGDEWTLSTLVAGD